MCTESESYLKCVHKFNGWVICFCCWEQLPPISTAHTTLAHSIWKHLRLFLTTFLAKGAGSEMGTWKCQELYPLGGALNQWVPALQRDNLWYLPKILCCDDIDHGMLCLCSSPPLTPPRTGLKAIHMFTIVTCSRKHILLTSFSSLMSDEFSSHFIL